MLLKLIHIVFGPAVPAEIEQTGSAVIKHLSPQAPPPLLRPPPPLLADFQPPPPPPPPPRFMLSLPP